MPLLQLPVVLFKGIFRDHSRDNALNFHFNHKTALTSNVWKKITGDSQEGFYVCLSSIYTWIQRKLFGFDITENPFKLIIAHQSYHINHYEPFIKKNTAVFFVKSSLGDTLSIYFEIFSSWKPCKNLMMLWMWVSRKTHISLTRILWVCFVCIPFYLFVTPLPVDISCLFVFVCEDIIS